MTAKLQKSIAGLGALAMTVAMAGCGGDFVSDSRSPARLVVTSLESDEQNTVNSDVIRLALIELERKYPPVGAEKPKKGKG